MELLKEQIIALDAINYYITLNNNVHFASETGLGKTTVVNHLEDTYSLTTNKPLIVYLTTEKGFSDRSYYPFLNYFANLNTQDLVEINKMFSSSIDKFSENHSLLSFVFNLKKNHSKQADSFNNFRNKDKEIISKLQFISTQYNKIIFIVDNFNYWDYDSLFLIHLLINYKNSLIDKACFVFITTNNEPYYHEEIINELIGRLKVKKITLNRIVYADYLSSLCLLGLKKDIPISELKLLYGITTGHIGVLNELIKEFNDNHLNFNSYSLTEIELLNNIINSRIDSLGDSGKELKNILQYASAFGKKFSMIELEKTTHILKPNIINSIQKANELYLVSSDQDKHYNEFIHDISVRIFQNSVLDNNINIYNEVVKCLKELYPSDFLRRTYYYHHLKEEDKEREMYILEYIKILREKGYNNHDYVVFEKKLMNSKKDEMTFVQKYKDAYLLYNEKKYSDAIRILKSIGDILSNNLISEKYIFLSKCYVKSLNKNNRAEAVLVLNNQYCALNNEKDIEERILIQKIISNVHFNELKEATKAKEELISSLKLRIDFDEDAKLKYNNLKRKSSMLSEYEISSFEIKEALDFYKGNNGIPKYLKEYYMSLVNYTASLIIGGEFEQAYNLCYKGFALEKEYPIYDFPRQEILLNNFVISGYLANYLSIKECISIYEKIHLPLIASRLFFKSNQSIFYALDMQLDKAYNLLMQESNIQGTEEDSEKIYDYRVNFNCAIYAFLLNKPTDAKTLIAKCDKNSKDEAVDYSCIKKRESMVKEIIEKEDANEYTSDIWLHLLTSKTPEFGNQTWKYYGLGFAFTALSNWDD